MKYWGFLAAKLAVAAILLYGLWFGITTLAPPPSRSADALWAFSAAPSYLRFILTTCVFFGFACGVLYLCFLDQRYRCRVCLRRLRMPIETGSWGQMLQFGRPRIEYICIFGHGTLKVPEIHITGTESPDWKQHEDMWKELVETEESGK